MANLTPFFVVALLLAAAMGVASQTTSELFELHGSGSNVATGPLRKALDLFMSRAKPAVVVSYRSIGTNNAQVEFLAAGPNATVPDFATGNMPLPSATYQQLVNASATPLQIPLLFGTVSFFYNVPGVSQLNMSACTLAKIYTGAITSWTDPDIVLQNPLLAAVVPPGTNISSWKRAQASSGNMLAASTYFDAACPSVWTYGVGTDATNWPVISNSQGAYTTTALLSGIKDTPYTIGFEDSGDGLAAGLSEVQITNLANTTLTSTQADPVQVANAYDAVNITALDSDWSNVTFLDTPTNLSWPMTVALYLQVRKDSSFLGRNSGLLQALITFLLSDDVQSLWSEGHYVPLSSSMRATLTAAVPSFLTVNASSPVWTFENMTAQPGAGQADYVISGLRNTYATSTLFSLETRAASLENVAALGNEYQVHVAGSWYPSLYLRMVQNDLISMSRLPIDLTYRVVGTYQAQSEFKSPINMFQQQNHIKVGDLPLSSSDYAALTATPLLKGVLQVPIAVGGVSIYFNAPAFQYNPDGSTRVQLTACDVAGIFSGVFTNWNQISSLQSSTYSYPITPVAFGVDASQTYVLTRYMATGCPMLWRQGYNASAMWPATAKTTMFGKTIMQPWEMMVAISSTPYSIGYLESSLDALEARYGYLPHLYEAPIQVRNGSYVIASQVDFGAVATQMFASTTLPRDAVGLPDLAADWSSVNPVGADAWPLSYITYAYVYQNLTLYGPSGPLIKSMLTYVFDDDPTNSADYYGMTPIPKDLRVAFANKIQTSLVVAPFQPEWAIEDRWTLGPGFGLYTFSRHRSNFLTTAVTIQEMEMRLMQGRVSAALPKLGRLLGVIEFSNLTGRMLTDVMGMAASPVRLTYETAATSQAAVDIFVGAGNGYKGYHDMLLLDQPLPADAYATLQQNNVQVVQAPVFVHAVALYYNGSGSAGLLRNLRPSINISACTLARAWNGSLKWWNDNNLLAENDYYKNTMLKLPFQLAYAQSESYKLTAVRRYIMAGCNTTVPPLPVGAQVFPTQDQLAAAIQMQPLFLMGIMSRLYGNPYNLTIVKVKSQYKYKGVAQYVEPSKPPPGVNISNTYLIQPMLDATLPKPTDDWSNFSMVWTDTMGKGYYPIMSSAFVVMRADLTFSNESGGLVKGLLAYMLGPWQQQLADTAYSGRLPGGTGMAVPTPPPTANVSLILKDQQATAALRTSLQNQVLPQIQTAQNVQQWPLAPSRMQIDGSPNAIITNLWKPADYSDAQLQQSDVTARLLANQLAVLKNAIATQQATQDQLAKVESIAIAGVVISVLLSFLAVLLGACWFRKNKRTVQDIIDKLNSHPAMYNGNNGTASERTGLMAA